MSVPSLFRMAASNSHYLLLAIIYLGSSVLYPQTNDSGKPKPKKTQAKYSVVRDCPRPHYNFHLRITPDASQAGREGLSVLELIFGYQDPYNFYRLILSNPSVERKETVVLLRRQNGKEEQIASSAKGLPLGDGGLRLLIKRRQSLLSILIDSEIFIETIDSTFFGGKVAVRIDKGLPKIHGVKYQAVSDISFGDDFMRSRGEHALWATLRGYWRVYFLAQDAQRSPNAFSFRGASTQSRRALEQRVEGKWGMSKAGYNFWDNYKASVSVKSGVGAVGLAFYCKSEEDYYLFRWEVNSFRETPGKAQLLRAAGENREVLAEGYLPSKTDQWYRLGVAVFGSRIKTYVDGREIFDCSSQYLAGGGIGLYVEGNKGAYFDDVKLQSYRVFDFDNPASAERFGEPGSGEWELAGSQRTQEKLNLLTCAAPGEARYLLGDPRWKDYVFETYLRAPENAETVGLIFNYRNRQNHLLFRSIGVGRPNGRFQLVKVGAGTDRVLAETAGTFKPGRWHYVKVNLRREGVVEVHIDGDLRLRVRDRDSLRSSQGQSFGRVGFYALNAEGVSFGLARVLLSDEAEESDREKVVSNRVFANDEYMAGWSSPRGAWSVSRRTRRTYWHKGDFYGRYSISIPFLGQSAVYLAAQVERPETGYSVALVPGKGRSFGFGRSARYLVTLSRLGKQRKQVEVQAKTKPRKLTVSREGRYMWVELDGNEVLSFSDDEPLPGTRVGVYTKSWMSAERIGVTRSNVKDYTFELAPVDWLRLGRWEVTSRFTCDLRWSWFGGSSEGPASIWRKDNSLKGDAIIWHKDDFPGDLTLELYMAMRMHLDRFPWVARPGDMNAVIAADGKDISSGYSFILSGWGNEWTRILRKGEIVAETDERLIPSNRHERPSDEDFHRRWFYVKIRKIGNKLEYYFDNRLILQYEDPDPLRGTKVGIWTYDNSIMVSRAKISYQTPANHEWSKVVIPDAPTRQHLPTRAASAIPAQISIASPTHPGAYFGFETGLEGWSNPSGEQGAFLSVDTTTSSQGKASLNLQNINTGGDFGAEIPLPQARLRRRRAGASSGGHIDPSRATELAFDYKMPPDAKVNIYLKIAGRLHFIELTGRSEFDENLRRLGKIEDVKADNKWHHATFDLASAVRGIFPYQKQLTIEKLLIGNFHSNTSYRMVGNYLTAGFGGNGAGVSYHLDEFRILTGGGSSAEFSWRLREVNPQDGARLDYSYTLDRNPQSEPDDVSEGTDDSKRYRDLRDGLWFFHIKPKRANGDWGMTSHFPIHVDSRPLTIASIDPHAGSTWGGSPIRLALEPKDGLNLDMSGLRLILNGATMAAPHAALSYDWRERALTIDLGRSNLSLGDGEKVDFQLQFCKRLLDESLGANFGGIVKWYVIGPFENEDDKGFDTVYPPEIETNLSKRYRGANGETVTWQEVASHPGEAVDLNRIIRRHWAVAYALTYVDCPAEKYVQFALGSNEGVKVWVNDELVWTNHTHRLLRMDDDRFGVELRKGLNKILLKVDQETGGWGFIVRMADMSLHNWSYTFSPSLDTTPPSPVEVDGYLVNDTFEKNMGAWNRNGEAIFMHGLKNWVRTDMEDRALLSRDDSTAASGRYSLKVFNPLIGGVFGAIAWSEPFNAGKYPLLAFDYKISDEIHTDFVIRSRGSVRNIAFTDNDNDLGRLGSIRRVKTDNQWHHAEVNLREMLSRQYYHDGMYRIDEIAMGDWGYQGNNEGAVYHIDNFQIIPVMSGRNGVKLSWRANDISGVKGYSYAWTVYSRADSKPGAFGDNLRGPIKTPDRIIDTTRTMAVFQGIAEGEAYLSIRAQDNAGNWGETSSYRFIIDNTPPVFVAPSPAPNTTTWSTTVQAPIRDVGGSGLDPSSVTFAINGKTYKPGRRSVYLRSHPWTLTCDWKRALGENIRSGSPIEFTISARDFAGNASNPHRWKIVYDRRRR